MKKKIMWGLGIFAALFFLSGLSIIFCIEKATSDLNTLVQLHQVELLREHLLMQMRSIQYELKLSGTHYAKEPAYILRYISTMKTMLNDCSSCHHSPQNMAKLNELRDSMDQYSKGLEMVSGRARRPLFLEVEQRKVLKNGEDLIGKLREILLVTVAKLEERTGRTQKSIRFMKGVLYGIVFTVPLLAVGMIFVFGQTFTKPLKVLLDATRKLRSGDMDFRVRRLDHEFGEVALSFNEMAEELKRHVAAIEESETRYRVLFESAVDAILIIDTEGSMAGRIIDANQAAAKMHGYEVEELQKLFIGDLNVPEEIAGVPCHIAGICRGERLEAEIDHRRKDGTVFPVEVSAGLLEIKGRKFILAFYRDISARRKAEEKLQRAERLRMCGEFSASVAHEIKNPLACMKFAIQVLSEESTLPEKDQDLLMKIVCEIDRIEGLMRQMLNFTRPPKPQMVLMDINKVLAATIAFSQKHPSISGSGGNKVEILTAAGTDIPPVMADPVQLQQIFLNLLINAAEAIPGEGRIEVRSEYVRAEEKVQITFSDSGHGIEEEMLDKIFDPFFTTKSKGSGMGLAIVKRLVEQHDGSISVRKKSEGETIFSINFPLCREKDVAA